jgi:TonB family protein
MTHVLSNVAAFSVQLAVLVATGAVFMAALRVKMPRAALWFWQGVFVMSLLWPGFQLWTSVNGPLDVFAGAAWWRVASSRMAETRSEVVGTSADLETMIVMVLATGVVLRLGWLCIGLIRLRSIRAVSEPAHSLGPIAASLQHELRVTADIRFSDAVSCPATVGMRRPVVLLPRQVQHLAPAVQRAVLTHELIHVRRRDWLPTVIEEVWCAALWFHPAARALTSRLSLARETLVDQTTIARTGDLRAYGTALLTFLIARPQPLGATALIGRRHLEQRITLIAQEASMARSSFAVRIVVTAAAVVLTTLATTSHMPIGATLQARPAVARPSQDTESTLPQVVRKVKPVYTPAAMHAQIQGSVLMTAVVLANGDVGDIAVIRSLDIEHGLDQQAIDALRQWKFKPGTRGGKPVPVEVTVEMSFTLKN